MLPARLILQTTPCSAEQTLELVAGVMVALVGMMQSASGLPRRPGRMTKASAMSCAVMLALIDQPSTRRGNQRRAPVFTFIALGPNTRSAS
jgi:hypothetical protein